MALTKPTTFTSGTIKASEVNDDFDTLYDALGSQEFTEQNYITNDETVTTSLDELDQALKDVADSVTGVLSSQTFSVQTSLPSTTSNQIKIYAADGASSAEALLYFARENAVGEIACLIGNASHKQWVYRNDTTPGWVIDSTVTDRVIGLKGGTGDYNVAGGTQAGSWSHTHSGGTVSGSTSTATAANRGAQDVDFYSTAAHSHTFSASVTIGTNSTFRPYAAIGTLQGPDMSGL